MSLLPCNIGVGEVQLDDLQCNYEGHNLVPSFPSPKKEEIEYNGKTFVPEFGIVAAWNEGPDHYLLVASSFRRTLQDGDRCCLDKQVSWFSRNIRTLGWENIDKLQYNVAAWNLKMGYQRLTYLHQSSTGKHPMAHVIWRRYSMPVSLVESSSLKSEDYSSNDHATESPKELLAQPLSRDELHIKEDALVNFKSELAVLELEVQKKEVACNSILQMQAVAVLSAVQFAFDVG
ncbi:protein PTST, chloroplastic isoform X2 [Fagus crenata]